MAKGSKSGDDPDWDHVFSKGAYCIGGGFMVGCGLSALTSSTWPVLFSTGVGLGLACVNLENEMWNKGQKASVAFENPWLRVKRKNSEEKPSGRDEEVGEKLGRREKTRSMETPRPHWLPDQEPVPDIPLDKDRGEAEAPGKESREVEAPGKDRREAEYSGKEPPRRDYPEKDYIEREFQEREYRDKEFPREAKPCPRAPKKKKAQSQKKEQEVKEKKNIDVEADPSLLVD